MLSHNIQERGCLSYVEFDDLTFFPKRMYFIYGVPQGEVRGKHGHRHDQQYLTCIQGQIKVNLISKDKTEEKILNVGDSIFVDKMVWGEQEYLTGNDIMHVLCSTKFNQDDYIYNLQDILGG